jgi:hypothetical protein
MSILKYSNKANPAASAKNMEYITRDSAADSISFHNLDDLHDDDKTQAKSNAINYAEERQLEEESRIKGNERGTPRNHNRMILSWDRKEDTATAKEETHKFLDKEFPNQRAVVSVHQDQDKTHIHVWFDCRDIDTDKKTQLPAEKFYTLDERWAKQYDEKYKTNYEKEYKEKKAETRDWKKEQAQLKRDGKQPRPKTKPQRANDDKAKILQNKEYKDRGIDETATRKNQRPVTKGRAGIERSEQQLDNSKQAIDRRAAESSRADSAFNDGIQEAKRLRADIERRNLEKEKNHTRGR